MNSYEKKPDSYHQAQCMEAAQVLIKHEADLSKVTLTTIDDPNNKDEHGGGYDESVYNYYAGGVVGG